MNYVSKDIKPGVSLSLSILLITLLMYTHNHAEAAEANLSWHTFQGTSAFELANAVATDDAGNTFLVGKATSSWGTPLEEFGIGLSAIVVAKLNAAGELQWHTFLGGDSSSEGNDIALDENGNIYITGFSSDSWGTPLNAHSGRFDIVILKLNSAGVLQWNTFFGSASDETGYSITLDAGKNILVTGSGPVSWGVDPVNPITGNGSLDIFVLKLNSAGALQWNTFHGDQLADHGASIVADTSGNIYVAGQSRLTWGSPVRSHAGGVRESVVFKLDSAGALQWNTFLGSSESDNANSIDLDKTGLPYVTGRSFASWPGVSPLNAHTVGTNSDFYLAKLDTSGNLLWHTFHGSTADDSAATVAVDCNGDIFIGGLGGASWGTPVNAFAGGGFDFNILKLDTAGSLLWHTFLGSTGEDLATGLDINGHGFLSVAGYGNDWGTPVNDNAGGRDIMVAAYSGASFCFRIFDSSFE